MAGGIEEPFRLSFQANSWQFGPISFGRFENEALCWERRSSFTQNRYLEEVEKCIKPGSVTEKRAYFEELFRRRALLSQSSSDCQDGADSQASNDGSENTDYEGEIKQLRRNLNFKATPMPAFYREPGRRSEKNKDGQSWEEAGARAAVRGRWRMDRKREILDVLRAKPVILCVETRRLASKTKSQSRPSTAAGARSTSATENTVRCLRAEVYNRCSTNERLNVADSPQVSEATVHPSVRQQCAVFSSNKQNIQANPIKSNSSSKESARENAGRKFSKTKNIRLYQERNKDFKAEDKTKVGARRTGNNAVRKDVRSVDLSYSTGVGRLAVGVAS